MNDQATGLHCGCSPYPVPVLIKRYVVCAKKLLKLAHEGVVIARVIHSYRAKLQILHKYQTRHLQPCTNLVLKTRIADNTVEQPCEALTTVIALQNMECQEEILAIQHYLADFCFRMRVFDGNMSGDCKIREQLPAAP